MESQVRGQPRVGKENELPKLKSWKGVWMYEKKVGGNGKVESSFKPGTNEFIKGNWRIWKEGGAKWQYNITLLNMKYDLACFK